MGYTTSTIHGIEVPDSSEANDIPEDIGKVVTGLEGGSIIRRLTSAAIAALTAPQKPAGTVFYNTTTGKLQISNGSTVGDIPYLLLAGGTMTGNIAMGSNKVTGLADGTDSTDAATRGQAVLRTGANAMTGNLAMGSHKITGLAAATTNGDAVRYNEFDALNLSKLRAGTVSTASYTTGGVRVNFSSSMGSTPYLTIGQTVNVGSATPLHIMPYGVDASGFYYKAFTFGAVLTERAAGEAVLFDYIAVLT